MTAELPHRTAGWLSDEPRPGQPPGGGHDAGTAPDESYPLVADIDGAAQWSVEVDRRLDLAAVPAQATSDGHVSAVDGNVVHNDGLDVVGVYFNPPEGAVVLSVDDESQIQALDRSQPVLPGMPERRTHAYVRQTDRHVRCRRHQ